MDITGRIRPKSIKIIATLDNYDFRTSHIHTIIGLYFLGIIPIKALQPNDLDMEEYPTDEYPIEKIMESLDSIIKDSESVKPINLTRKISHIQGLHHRLDTLRTVAESLAKRLEGAIEELKGAPLEININMDSWLEKPAGYVKEIDDYDGD